jgi:hypothetical protein
MATPKGSTGVTVATTVLLAVSITATLLKPSLVTYTCFPSGVAATPKGAFPTGTVGPPPCWCLCRSPRRRSPNSRHRRRAPPPPAGPRTVYPRITTGPPDVRGPEYFQPSNRTKTPLQSSRTKRPNSKSVWRGPKRRSMRHIDNRLRRLERQNAARRLKQVILWDDGSGSAQIKAAAIEREHGGKVEVVLVRWRTDAEPNDDCAFG